MRTTIDCSEGNGSVDHQVISIVLELPISKGIETFRLAMMWIISTVLYV